MHIPIIYCLDNFVKYKFKNLKIIFNYYFIKLTLEKIKYVNLAPS